MGINIKDVEDPLCFPEHTTIWEGQQKGRKTLGSLHLHGQID